MMEEIRRNPPAIPGFTMDRLLYLIYLIVSHRQEPHPGSYSVLNMQYMENVVPRAHEYLRYLKEHGIIEWVNHANYEGLRHSRLYRLTDKHGGETVCRTLKEKKLEHFVELHYMALRKSNSRAYPELNKWVYKVRINEAEALAAVEREFTANVQRNKLYAYRARDFGRIEIDKIVKKRIYIRVNKTNGRYDTNFTRLPGYLVPYLTINNSSLVEIDIANSQPFFAACAFNPTSEIAGIIRKSSLYQKYSPIDIDTQDIKEYTKLVTSGRFYDFMMSKFDEARITYYDRADFKEKLFLVYFGRVDTKYTSRAVRLFAKLFPTVSQFFNQVKADQHNQLAILLQKFESYTMLKKVAPAIASKYPDLPFITKHDSLLPAEHLHGLLIQESRVEEVKDLIQDVIENTTGLRPIIRIKGQQVEPRQPQHNSHYSLTHYLNQITSNLITPPYLYHYVRKTPYNELIYN